MNKEQEDQLLEKVTALYQQGNAQDAVTLLNNTIVQHPHFAEAYFYLGCFFQENNQLEDAWEYYKKTLQENPQHFDALVNSGNVLFTQNQTDKALEFYKRALSLQPQNTDLLSNYGYLLTGLKRYDEALASFNLALAENANHIGTLNNKAFLLCETEQFEEALLIFNHLLTIDPHNVTALCNRYSLFHRLKRPNEALTDCYRVLDMYPDHLDTLKVLANSLIALNKYKEAIEIIDRALPLTPEDENTSMLYSKAILLKSLRQFDQSITVFTQLLKQKPTYTAALIERGLVYGDLEDYGKAFADFERILAMEPENVAAWTNKAYMFNQCRMHNKAALCYQHIIPQLPDDAGARIAILLHMQHMCDWSSMSEHITAFKQILARQDYLEIDQLCGSMPSVLLSIPGITPQEQLLYAKKYNKMNAGECPSRAYHQRLPSDKIHVGYFSVDFNQHPVSQLMVEVLELHNREQFTVSAYATKASDNSLLRKRIEKSVDHFIDVTKMNNEEVVQKIMSDNVDILIDLSGYTINSRSILLSLRPAPIQVNYLGFLGTMGADFMDYIIADDFLIPAGCEQFYSEKVIRLPSYQANDRQYVIGKKPARTDVGLPEHVTVFCCFNMNYKFTADVFAVWCKLLNNIPGSVLWLFTASDDATNNLRKEAARHGVNSERLIFAPWLPIDQHMTRIACADLFLDTAPYNAGTTASNALWAGVPVITCAGSTFSSRMAGSLLTALNMPELITHSLEDYYQLAYELATQTEKRNQIRDKIAVNKDSALLFNSKQFTLNLENAYRDMMKTYLSR